MDIKKAIAREGLILIGIILLACLITFISSIYPPYYKPTKGKFDITTESPIKNKITYLDNGETRVSFEDGTIIRFESKPSQQDINEAYLEAVKRKSGFDISTAKPVKDYYAEEIEGKNPLAKYMVDKPTPEQARTELNRRTDEKRNRIMGWGLSILFIAYALYLIPIKFILWAIRILKAK